MLADLGRLIRLFFTPSGNFSADRFKRFLLRVIVIIFFVMSILILTVLMAQMIDAKNAWMAVFFGTLLVFFLFNFIRACDQYHKVRHTFNYLK